MKQSHAANEVNTIIALRADGNGLSWPSHKHSLSTQMVLFLLFSLSFKSVLCHVGSQICLCNKQSHSQPTMSLISVLLVNSVGSNCLFPSVTFGSFICGSGILWYINITKKNSKAITFKPLKCPYFRSIFD